MRRIALGGIVLIGVTGAVALGAACGRKREMEPSGLGSGSSGAGGSSDGDT